VSTAGRWATSPLVLFLVVLAVHQVVVVDSTDNDPSLAPWTALSLVHDGDTDLRDVPAEVLVDRPLVVPGQPPGQVFTSADQVRAALGAAGVDAPVRDYFPVVPALLAVPAVVAVDLVGPAIGWGDARQALLDDRFGPAHVLSASMVVALAALVARAVALRLVGGSAERRRWLATGAALVFAFGTTAWSVASRALWQHGPSLLLLFVALWLVLELRDQAGVDPDPAAEGGAPGGLGRERPAARWVGGALGVVLTFAVVTRPTNAVPAVALVAWVAWSRRAVLVPVVVGAVRGAALSAGVVALLGLGVPPPYYSASRISIGAQTVTAVAANLVSPSRGLLISTPVVLLAVPGAWLWWRSDRDRPLVVALVAWAGGVVVAVSAFGQWWAGHTFAARFATETLPALFLLALPAVDAIVPGRADTAEATGSSAPSERTAPAWMHTRTALVALVAVSVWSVGFHSIGAWSRQTSCWNELPVDVDDDPGRVWSLTDSQTGRAVGALLAHGPRRAVAGPC